MKVSIPRRLKDITLDQWQKFDVINKEGSDEDFLIDKMIEIFCELDLKDVAKIPFDDAQEIYKDLVEVLNEESDFVDRFELNGVEYGFIPNLQEMTLGEFVDLDNYLLDTKNLHKAMAVLYRPVTYKHKKLYQIEPYESANNYSDVMLGCPVNYATGAVVFFYRLSNELTKASLFSSLKVLKETELITPKKDNSQQSTDGYSQSIPYVKETLQSLIKSLN